MFSVSRVKGFLAIITLLVVSGSVITCGGPKSATPPVTTPPVATPAPTPVPTPTPAPAIPSISFSASAYSITSGSPVILSVSATNAVTVTIAGTDGSSYSLAPTGGTQSVTPATTTTYTATATSSVGCVSAAIPIVVTPLPVAPAPTQTVFPISTPGNAVYYANIDQLTGWSADASSSISPNPPTVYTINQSGSPIVMTLDTTGTLGKYTGWMAKKTISTSGQSNMLIRATYVFSSVSGIQAWEVGRRSTDSNGVTDNGQTQLVPIKGGLLEFDIVPSASGGWKDTGCRFPTFVAGTTYNEEIYYVDDASGSLSVMYVELNGTVCSIPSNLQSVTGASLGWSPNSAVIAFQPDANPSAVAYNAMVTMNVWVW